MNGQRAFADMADDELLSLYVGILGGYSLVSYDGVTGEMARRSAKAIDTRQREDGNRLRPKDESAVA